MNVLVMYASFIKLDKYKLGKQSAKCKTANTAESERVDMMFINIINTQMQIVKKDSYKKYNEPTDMISEEKQ
jgi:hypothetical protein